MIEPPDEQVRAGQIATGAVSLARALCRKAIDGKRLDKEVEAFIRDEGGVPALKGYHPPFALKPYEHTICLGIDNEVVHGVPIKLIGPAHLVTVDLVVKVGAWHADHARTFTVSEDPEKQQFAQVSEMIFEAALDAVAANSPINLFGMLVQNAAELNGYGVIKEYCGHGIGKAIHTDPQVLNYHTTSTEVFEVGRSYAVEPVLSVKRDYSLRHSQHDGFTVIADCLASHNEDTLFIGENGVINLTGNQS